MNRTQRGFTLIELTVVILVLGVIIAFVLPAVIDRADSEEMAAINTVNGYITEYKAEHTIDRVDDVTVIHSQGQSLYVFGYNFDDGVLYIFSGAIWLTEAQGKIQSSTFTHVAANIVTSANHDPSSLVVTENPYPDAVGIFTGNTDLKGEFSSRTQKKMQDNTLFLNAQINRNYSITYNEIEYRFVRADAKTGTDTAAAEYTTVFKNSDGAVMHTFSTKTVDSFVCPDDPVKAGEQFLYWKLVEVNGESKNIPALALVAGDTYDVPNSNVVYKAVYGSTTPERVDGAYQLYGAKHLKWFADYANDSHGGANAVLVRSFDAGTLTVSIGTSSNPYHGTFDGNGNKLMNLTMTASGSGTHTALFGYTDGAVIKDLTITNPTITGNTYVAVLVAEARAAVNNTTGAYTSNATKITNCKIENASVTCADVQADDGATAEQIENLAQQKIFKDRYEIQNVVEYQDLGEGPVPVTVPRPVLKTEEKGTYCGGLVGFGENVEIRECSVSGIIAGGNNGAAVGGIMGAACGTHVVIGTSGSTKIGASTDVTVSGVRYVGGIIGKTVNSAKIAAIEPAVTVTTGVEIYNSYAAGKVTRSTNVMELPQTGYLATTKTEYCIGFGGIVGGTKSSFLMIEGCDTTKAAEINPVQESSYTGGILGYAEEGEITINNSQNNAKRVSSRYSAGGIVGASRDVRLIVANSTNNGAVDARNTAAGGILGYAKTTLTNTRAPKVVKITDCTNNAAVTSVKRAGGILGEAERNVTISDATNTAAVSETTTAAQDGGCGGIVGYSAATLTLTKCENTGDVTSTMQSAGGAVGRITSYTTVKTSDVPTLHDMDELTYPEDTPEYVTLSSEGSVFTGCTNSGAIIAPKRAGGILGDALRAATLTNCTNTGAVTENFADLTALTEDTGCGGIAGYTVATLTITNCTNEGTVTSYCQGVGGIVGKATSAELGKSSTALTTTEKEGLADADDTTAPPTPEGTYILTSAGTAITNSINKGMVENAPADSAEIVAVTEPADPADPAPVYPYKYSGGIVGYADEPVSIQICINASYVAGQDCVGGIAGALVKKDGALQSSVRRCISVGIVEARNNTGTAKAGAIMGTGEWRINYTYNVYLDSMVHGQNVTSLNEIIKNDGDASDIPNYASRYNANSFMDADRAVVTLNRDGEGSLIVPVYQLPDNSDPENPAVFAYAQTLTDAVAAYAALPSPITVTLPTFLPEFYVEPTV